MEVKDSNYTNCNYGPLLGNTVLWDVAVYRDIKTLTKREKMTGEGYGR